MKHPEYRKSLSAIPVITKDEFSVVAVFRDFYKEILCAARDLQSREREGGFRIAPILYTLRENVRQLLPALHNNPDYAMAADYIERFRVPVIEPPADGQPVPPTPLLDQIFGEAMRGFVDGLDRRIAKVERQSGQETILLAMTTLDPNQDRDLVLPEGDSYPGNEQRKRKADAFIRRESGLIRVAIPEPVQIQGTPGIGIPRGEPSPVKRMLRGMNNFVVAPADELTDFMLIRAQLGYSGPIGPFWEQVRTRFPHLSGLVTKMMAMPSSGAEVERFFSRMRAVLSYLMGASRLETLSLRLFLHLNREITEKIMNEHPDLCPHGRGI
jgi:hypothetical protein